MATQDLSDKQVDIIIMRQRLRDACDDVEVFDVTASVSVFFDQAVQAIRRHFKVTTDQAELVLADARLEAERYIDNSGVPVDLDEVVKVIAEHIVEGSEEDNE